MTRRKATFAALATIAAALAISAPVNSAAAADLTLPHVPIEQAIGEYLPTARAQWPGSPCAGRETIHINADIDAGYARDDHGIAPPYELGGYAVNAECRVELSSTLYGYDLCAMLTHELGHLDGQEHSSDPRSIMFAGLTAHYTPCETASQAIERFPVETLATYNLDVLGQGRWMYARCGAPTTTRAPAWVNCSVRYRCSIARWRTLVASTYAMAPVPRRPGWAHGLPQPERKVRCLPPAA